MNRLLKTFSDYYNQQDFRLFLNSLAQKVYEALGTSYSNSDGEVKIVTDLCKAIDGESYNKRLNFHAKKIHDSRSFVEFHNQNRLTTKELADMVIISIATKDREIVFEKTAFIQNKKEDAEKNTWKIDQDQLYLLHNFPTFKGQKGIFKKNFTDEVIFQNYSESLGNYGLFQSPGEMILVNALTVFRLQQGDKISFSDIRKYPNTQNNVFSFPLIDYPFWDEMLYRYFKHFPKYGFPLLNLPFLGNNIISFNVYEFIRNWSLFNIGEVVSIGDKVANYDLRNFNRTLLHSVGLSNSINLRTEKQQYESDDDLVILVAHINLDEKE
ncbi:MAG: hypothetical protein LBR81_02590 [Prevotellaceae bacterium]|jgi:hypothetical protein|nr:hypothetical protein [Prevotellaceae bacterium]